jgi:hypothetical protein
MRLLDLLNGAGFKVYASKFHVKVQSLRFKVQGSKFKVWGDWIWKELE